MVMTIWLCMRHCYIYNICGQSDGKMGPLHLDVMFATVLCLDRCYIYNTKMQTAGGGVIICLGVVIE